LAGLSVAEAEAVRLHPTDNVVVAPRRIAKGVRIASEGVVTVDSIPMGHKLATRRIAIGEIVRKYGQVIGIATADIAPGSHVHVHNIAVSELRAAAQSVTNRRTATSRSEASRAFGALMVAPVCGTMLASSQA